MSSPPKEQILVLRSVRIPALLVGAILVGSLAFGASLLGRVVTITCERSVALAQRDQFKRSVALAQRDQFKRSVALAQRDQLKRSPAAACRLRADTWVSAGEETVVPLALIRGVRFGTSKGDTNPGARRAPVTSFPVFELEDGETIGLNDYGHFDADEKEAAAAALDAFLRTPERARVFVRYGGFASGALAAFLVCFFLVPVALHFGVATFVVQADEKTLRAKLRRGLFADESVIHRRRGRELVRVDSASGRVVVINGYDIATELPRLPWSRIPPCELAAKLRAALGPETR